MDITGFFDRILSENGAWAFLAIATLGGLGAFLWKGAHYTMDKIITPLVASHVELIEQLQKLYQTKQELLEHVVERQDQTNLLIGRSDEKVEKVLSELLEIQRQIYDIVSILRRAGHLEEHELRDNRGSS